MKPQNEEGKYLGKKLGDPWDHRPNGNSIDCRKKKELLSGHFITRPATSCDFM